MHEHKHTTATVFPSNVRIYYSRIKLLRIYKKDYCDEAFIVWLKTRIYAILTRLNYLQVIHIKMYVHSP